MQSTLIPLMEKFEVAPAATRDELRTYAECDPSGFRDEAIAALVAGCDVNARNYIINLLVHSADLVDYITDASQCGFDRAVAVAKQIQCAGAALDALLEDKLGACLAGKGYVDDLMRILDLLHALGAASRAVAWRPQLMAHSDSRLRAKAARVIAAGSKSLSWVASLLADKDFRVQANAVEALWDIADADVKPLLTIASRSRNGRVAANALLGLYHRGVLESVPALLKMASQPDMEQRSSALWAIGETMDPRFLPYLARAFETVGSKDRQAVIRALARIRRQVKQFETAGEIRINVLESRLLPDRSRKLMFAASAASCELPALGPMQFTVSEDDTLIVEYSVRRIAAPPFMIFGFVLPRFTSTAEPLARSVAAALDFCTALKRPADLWCFRRYRLHGPAQPSGHESDPTLMAAEDPRLALHLKNHHGLLRDVEFVRQLASEPGPRDRAAADVAEAVDAAVEVSERVSGARQLFVFFAGENPDDRRLQQLAASLRTEAVSIHGFVLEGSEGVGALRDVCEATPNGSLRVVSTAANLCDCVASAYLNLMTRYEITYPAPDNAEPRLCTLLVCSPHGCGRETIDFRRLAQPAKAD